MTVLTRLGPEESKKLAILCFEHLIDWQLRSAAAFRNAVLSPNATLMINPLLNTMRENESKFIRDALHEVVSEGRMVDFGFVPNVVIQAESVRARDVFENDEMIHPYEHWVGVMPWEGGYNGYLVINNAPLTGHSDITVIELYAVSVPNVADVVIVYDVVRIEPMGSLNTRMTPALMSDETMNSNQELRNRGSNSLDPLVTMLRFLADASIPIVEEHAPVRLNRHRVKQGKFPIPAHTVVHTRDYVTNWNASTKQGRSTPQGGHHASPIAHWRKSHKRTLQSGKIIPVKGSKVNWRDSEELHRLFYRAKV